MGSKKGLSRMASAYPKPFSVLSVLSVVIFLFSGCYTPEVVKQNLVMAKKAVVAGFEALPACDNCSSAEAIVHFKSAENSMDAAIIYAGAQNTVVDYSPEKAKKIAESTIKMAEIKSYIDTAFKKFTDKIPSIPGLPWKEIVGLAMAAYLALKGGGVAVKAGVNKIKNGNSGKKKGK